MTRVPRQCQIMDILSRKEVALNVGASHGITLGTKFQIQGRTRITLSTNPPQFEDIIFTKAEVMITYVGQNISVARTFRPPLAGINTDGFAPDLQLDERITTTTNPNWTLVVSKGDPAVEILE